MATPLVLGLPNQRLLPALPDFCKLFSELESEPIVAKHEDNTILISPLGNFKVTYLPSLATRVAKILLLANSPFPGVNSIL